MEVIGRARYPLLEVRGKVIFEPKAFTSSVRLQSPSPPSSTVVPHMFAFLPIHAAGIYNTEGGENASDYIVHPILLL